MSQDYVPRPTISERAFQLARSGELPALTPIKAQLKREGYTNVESHFSGRALRQEVARLCAEARAKPALKVGSE
jgi:hypothetical protein